MKNKDLKILFMGTSIFAVPILQKLNANYTITLVVTKDGKKTPVEKEALKLGLKVFKPVSLKKEEDIIINTNADVLVTASYGKILPKDILNAFKYKPINVHASLLPKYRGGAPITRAIENGEEYLGNTIMYMEEGLDTGDIISQEKIKLEVHDNYLTMVDKLSVLGAKMIDDVLKGINNIKSIKQNEEEATYAKLVTKEDLIIDFNDTNINVFNKIRSLEGLGVYIMIDNKRYKIFNIEMDSEDATPGLIYKITKDKIYIGCHKGSISFKEIQAESRNRMPVRAFLNGFDKNKLLDKKIKYE